MEQTKQQGIVPPVVEEEQPQATAFLQEVDLNKRYQDVLHLVQATAVQTVEWRNGAYVFVCENGVQLRVFIIENGILRFWYHPTGQFGPDFSYAIDPLFIAEKPFATLDENDKEYVISTPLLQVVVQKEMLSIRIFDATDKLILEQAAPSYVATLSVMKGWSDLKTTFKLPRKAGFFGLGDKAASGGLRGKLFTLWCTDAYGYGDESDPLYRAIPFVYCKTANHTFGLFLDNTYRSFFDLGHTDADLWSVGSDGGDINFYFLLGPSALDVSARYHRLTGVHEIPPVWALGFHQSRWSYLTHARVLEVAKRFREEQIPCDAIYLDIDYMDNYKVFTWNIDAFPDPQKLVRTLHADNIKVVAMIDPGVKAEPGYAIYEEGLEKHAFLCNADGELVLAPVWPGLCAFPDFTHPEVRSWFGELYKSLYVDCDLDGFWNDMNEPAVFYVETKTLTDHVRHHYEGHGASHRKAHNVYGSLMARSTYEGMKKLKPDTRPFLLSRASFAGGQRFCAIWTGDNHASWQHLQIANIQAVRMSISGISFVGSDIGGFAGEPDGELYLRWLQLSVFHPLMRVHSQGDHAAGDSLLEASQKANDREPWAFGDKWLALNKKAIELRYCLLGVLYTAFYRLRQFGKPILRPLAFEDAELRTPDNERDFCFADHVIVSPVVAAKVQRQMVHLPSGLWYHFWTGQQIAGGADAFIPVQLEEVPFFVRAGAVLPIYPIRQSTQDAIKELTLYAYYKNGMETSWFYEDEGEGYRHQTESWFSLLEMKTEGEPDYFSLKLIKTGLRTYPYNKITVIAVGLPYYVRSCKVDGQEQPIREIRVREKSIYSISIAQIFEQITWSAHS